MKDLAEALKEFDARDRERVQSVNEAAFYSGRISLEDQMFVMKGRVSDMCQLIAWMCHHIIELEKERPPH